MDRGMPFVVCLRCKEQVLQVSTDEGTPLLFCKDCFIAVLNAAMQDPRRLEERILKSNISFN
jgi:hypothetical protein